MKQSVTIVALALALLALLALPAAAQQVRLATTMGDVVVFVNLADNLFLDQARSPDRHGFAVFGRVVAGMDVVDRIAGVATGDRGGHQNVPLQPVVIQRATLENRR
jgi:cyclophilin family peptidyl-prolyl cis-trans isomerase